MENLNLVKNEKKDKDFERVCAGCILYGQLRAKTSAICSGHVDVNTLTRAVI